MPDYVALVFTDLVNSTAVKDTMLGNNTTERNQSYRDKILFPHRKRVIESLKKYEGRVVEPPQGDGFLLEFPSPVKAIEWSIFIQCSHQTEPISIPSGLLEMRIGIHYGAPLRDGDRLIGQEVDYAARVAALASKQQILLSKTIGVLIEDAKIKGVKIIKYGEYLLKGIGTVSVFELHYDEFKKANFTKDTNTLQATEVEIKKEYSDSFQEDEYNYFANHQKAQISSYLENPKIEESHLQEVPASKILIEQLSLQLPVDLYPNVTPSFLKDCQLKLANYIGPIASYIVEDILSSNPQITQQKLVELLSTEIPDSQQAKQFKLALL